MFLLLEFEVFLRYNVLHILIGESGAMLSLETITEMLNRAPCSAFRIITSSGDKYDVREPHLVVPGATQVFYCFPWSDRVAFIPLSQIASLETLAHAS